MTASMPTTPEIDQLMRSSWSNIAPFWPLKNLIAVNPLSGFEHLPFHEALEQGQVFFQQDDIPDGLKSVNRLSMKWLQAFFDEGQSTIHMPNRELGFLASMRSLFPFDHEIHAHDPERLAWLSSLPEQPEDIVGQVLNELQVEPKDHSLFLTLMLTTLPGWASHIRYRTQWADADHPHQVTEEGYLAFRLILTRLLWPEAKTLLDWHSKAASQADAQNTYATICQNERAFQKELLQQLKSCRPLSGSDRAAAQLVFCIDVRSEPFRRAIEAHGEYETYGFAGFFGVPVAIEDAMTGESYASCPVLLKPAHHVIEHPDGDAFSHHSRHARVRRMKKSYQSVKYTFTTPFNLAETLGITHGLWMGLKSLWPRTASTAQALGKHFLGIHDQRSTDIRSIPVDQQITYATNALSMMGLKEKFAPLVVLCGHGSTTQNNAYATALDCGACGGRHGGSNARILAAILNAPAVRAALAEDGIVIPDDTCFLAAEHNTTTDEVILYEQGISHQQGAQIATLKQDLQKARAMNSQWRAQTMGLKLSQYEALDVAALRSQDWSQVRPEWGLARNAAFIIGPRALTQGMDLQGRAFLHSYDWQQDPDGTSLTTILTAPMIVAQWINAQYLFSTLDNVAFGGGSKSTTNITGKMAAMQGNASDLMIGLPLQSVFLSDRQPYHQPVRLTVIVLAPTTHIEPIILKHPNLEQLCRNEWIHVLSFDPQKGSFLALNRDLKWDVAPSAA